jgi:predicted nucleic acid-binding protein
VTCFVDTSAFYAFMDAADGNHRKALRQWESLLRGGTALVTSNYVLVETFALLQSRLGMEATKTFQEDIAPVLSIQWVEERLHQSGVAGMLAASRKKLSLVDCVSFAIMRQLGVKSVFAFDRHFREQGFNCVP